MYHTHDSCVLFCGLVTVYRTRFGLSCLITFSLKSLIIFCTAGKFQPYAPVSSPLLSNFSAFSFSLSSCSSHLILLARVVSHLSMLWSFSLSLFLSVTVRQIRTNESENIWVTEPHEKQTHSATVQHTRTHRAWSVAVSL